MKAPDITFIVLQPWRKSPAVSHCASLDELHESLDALLDPKVEFYGDIQIKIDTKLIDPEPPALGMLDRLRAWIHGVTAP